MAKYEAKMKVTDRDVNDFIAEIPNEQKRKDSEVLLKIMGDITGEPAKMWGPTIVGFGKYHYKYASGHEGDCGLCGFSPRKQSLTIYFLEGFAAYKEELKKLGKHRNTVSCLYINKLSDIDLSVLKQMIEKSYNHLEATSA